MQEHLHLALPRYTIYQLQAKILSFQAFINLNFEQPWVILLHLAHFECLHMSGALEQVQQVRGHKRLLDLPKVDHTCGKWMLHSTCAYVIMTTRWRKAVQGQASSRWIFLMYPCLTAYSNTSRGCAFRADLRRHQITSNYCYPQSHNSDHEPHVNTTNVQSWKHLILFRCFP